MILYLRKSLLYSDYSLWRILFRRYGNCVFLVVNVVVQYMIQMYRRFSQIESGAELIRIPHVLLIINNTFNPNYRQIRPSCVEVFLIVEHMCLCNTFDITTQNCVSIFKVKFFYET